MQSDYRILRKICKIQEEICLELQRGQVRKAKTYGKKIGKRRLVGLCKKHDINNT